MLSPSTLKSSYGSSRDSNLDYKQDLEKLTSLCKELNPSSKSRKNLESSHKEYLHDEIKTLEKRLKETNALNYELKEQLASKSHEIEVFFPHFPLIYRK